MYTAISKPQEGSTCKDSHTKCFITTNSTVKLSYDVPLRTKIGRQKSCSKKIFNSKLQKNYCSNAKKNSNFEFSIKNNITVDILNISSKKVSTSKGNGSKLCKYPHGNGSNFSEWNASTHLARSSTRNQAVERYKKRQYISNYSLQVTRKDTIKG